MHDKFDGIECYIIFVFGQGAHEGFERLGLLLEAIINYTIRIVVKINWKSISSKFSYSEIGLKELSISKRNPPTN